MLLSLFVPSRPTGEGFGEYSSGLKRELRIYIRQHKIPESNRGCLSFVCNKEIKDDKRWMLVSPLM
jgi:hypothetical protein